MRKVNKTPIEVIVLNVNLYSFREKFFFCQKYKTEIGKEKYFFEMDKVMRKNIKIKMAKNA